MANILSKYRSLSRPTLSKSTGTYSSFAKQQVSAEDKIIDNQYENGNLSPEAYLSALNVRSQRQGTTPVQQVNLSEKIKTVQEKVNDSTVANQYQAGKLTTDQVLQYEQNKLSGMSATGGAPYIQQQQKVQQLIDKSEKEKRAAYRTSEMLRLSQLPDDASATAWEKAKVFTELSHQARLDGDIQQADQLQTQAYNSTNAAKKADINDQITQTRLSLSELPGEGLGVPTSDGGQARTTGSGLVQGGGTGGGGNASNAPSSVTTGFSGVTNSAVNNAMKSLDRQYKSYEKTAASINETNTLISKYQEIIPNASGDQKTQLTLALNNLLESKRQKENSLAITESGITDQVTRIQELQQKAAITQFSQDVRKNDQQFSRAETDLETAFAKGEINKEEYIQKGVALAATKAQFYSQSSDVFNQYGNDAQAQTFLDKSSSVEEIHKNLIGVAQNLDDYEPIAADPGGKVTNLLGKSIQPGEVALTNVRALKDSGDFNVNFTEDNGVFKRIYYPGQKAAVGDGYVSKATVEELSKNATSPDQVPYVYGGFTGIGPKTGKVEKQPLVKTSNGQFVTPSKLENMKSTANASLDQVLNKTNATQQLINQTKEKISSPIKQPSFLDRVLNPLGNPTQDNKQNIISSAISGVGSKAKDVFNNAVSGAKGVLGGLKDNISSAWGNVSLPPLVKKAYATYDNVSEDQLKQWAKRAEQETGINADLIIAQYKLESGNGASAPGNNYFGIKGNGSAGSQTLWTTENINGKNVKVKAKFAKYATPEDSFIAHARLLSLDPRYNDVKIASASGDLNKVADAIGNSPYATDPNYGNKIRQLLGLKVNQPVVNSVETNIAPANRSIPTTTIQTSSTPRSSSSMAVQGPATTNFNPTPAFTPKAPNMIVPQIQPKNIGQALTNLATNIKSAPIVQKVQSYVAPVIQKVQQAAAPVTNFVSNAVNTVKNTLSNLFKRK